MNNIYLLTGYEGIASLLSLRHWLLTEAIDASDVTFVTVIFILSRNYVILVGAANWKEPNDLTLLAYQEEIIMLRQIVHAKCVTVYL
jgi:hypothetical protein